MKNDPENLLLFDGVCNFCVGTTHFMIRHDKHARFSFIAIQSELGRALYQREGLDPEHIQTFVLIRGEKVYLKSDAVIEIANTLGGFWKVLNVFRIIPKTFRDEIYTFVAKNRYRWFGKRDL